MSSSVDIFWNSPSHFEHKNDVTVIIKLHRATRLQLVALYKRLTEIVTSFYVQNVIKHRFSWNNCQSTRRKVMCLAVRTHLIKALAKLANTAWQTLLFVSESLPMGKKETPDFRRKQ